MTTSTNEKCKNDVSIVDSQIYVTYKDISKVFKKIKDKGILNKKIVLHTNKIIDEGLLKTGDFIDKVIYHRLKKHYTKSSFAEKIGVDRDTYYQYENRTFKLNNIETIERIVEVLEMEEEDLPEYVQFIVSNPIDKIGTFMNKYNINKTTLSKNTNIPLRTIYSWFKGNRLSQISIKNFQKLKAYMGSDL